MSPEIERHRPAFEATHFKGLGSTAHRFFSNRDGDGYFHFAVHDAWRNWLRMQGVNMPTDLTPTQGEHAQPEAPYLQLADLLASGQHLVSVEREEAADAIRTLHAQVAALTASPQGGERAVPETLGVYCGIASDDVTDPTHPRYVAGFKAGHAAGKKRASHGQAPAATVIKKGADRQWMSERLGHLPDGIYSLYLAPTAHPAPAAHVQNPAEIEHVAGDVSKNGPESNMAQPAPAAPFKGKVERHSDQSVLVTFPSCRLASEFERQLRDGAAPTAQQPSPTPQADSQPAPANTRQIAECYGDCPTDPKTCANPCKFEGRAARAPADSGAAGSQVRRVERTTFPSSPAHKALSAFCSAVHDNEIDGADMRAAMLWFLGLEEVAPSTPSDSVTAPAGEAGLMVDRATVIEWLDANDIEVTDRQMEGLFHFAVPTPAAQRDAEDAARYRHLREADPDTGPAVAVVVFNDWGNVHRDYPTGEELDAAIDAARKQGANHD